MESVSAFHEKALMWGRTSSPLTRENAQFDVEGLVEKP
jgi:hypothetical protein